MCNTFILLCYFITQGSPPLCVNDFKIDYDTETGTMPTQGGGELCVYNSLINLWNIRRFQQYDDERFIRRALFLADKLAYWAKFTRRNKNERRG